VQGQCGHDAALRGTVLRRKVHEFLSIPPAAVSMHSSAPGSARPRSCPLTARTENISVTGMLIEAAAELRRGDLLQYSLDLAPARSFAMEAEVVRNDRGRYGVRFFPSRSRGAARHRGPRPAGAVRN